MLRVLATSVLLIVGGLLTTACGDDSAMSETGSGGSTVGSGSGQGTGGAGQGGEAVMLPSWDLDFLGWMDEVIKNLPGQGSEGFEAPNSSQRDDFRLACEALRDGDLAEAKQRAQTVQYQLVAIVDEGANDAVFYALLPNSWSSQDTPALDGRGLFFVRAKQEVNKYLGLSAPHPRFDSFSGLVATNAFRQLEARSLAIAGAHRCANATLSGCSGTTAVCGSPAAPYRESDMAHMDRAFFQVFHEVMDADGGGSIQHVQVHGFASGANDPEFTLSAGTSNNVADDNFTPNLLATKLAELTALAGSQKPGNSCNQTGDINRLCGSTNTQGRYTNGVDAQQVCTTSSGGASDGRFVHAELSKAIRDINGSIGPQVFIDALSDVF
ncbi:MAG: hypothetical protein VB934_10610 [Polyangiaceae bacterium]